MFKKLTLALSALVMAVAMPLAAEAKTFYWISHGSVADPVWTYFLAGAKQWATDTGNTVNTSFHEGNVASQQEAVRAAIAAKADGIVTTSPDPGSLVEVAKEANAANIPIINFNTPDPTASFDAYVGGDNVVFGRGWAQYLVDKGLVKKGDFVWMPVEIPGATYGVQEEEGIKSVFEPLGITYEVTEAKLDQAEAINRMVDYLTANKGKVKAIIGLGDLVTGSIKRVFDQVGIKPGEIPVVGWGNSLDTTQEVLQGYVNAAQWQDPQATSYVALSLANMAASGIPPGFNVITGALYEKDTAQIYDDILLGKEPHGRRQGSARRLSYRRAPFSPACGTARRPVTSDPQHRRPARGKAQLRPATHRPAGIRAARPPRG